MLTVGGNGRHQQVNFSVLRFYVYMEYKLEKWFPLQGERGLFSEFSKTNREEGETE